MGKRDDFVMTIEDDDTTINIVEEVEEEVIEEVESKPKKKNEKKRARKEQAPTDFDAGFTFAYDGGGSVGPVHAWDFSAARSMLKASQVGGRDSGGYILNKGIFTCFNK
ncbi:hypothetical protein BDF14DRAFT_1847429 [Spinellus fusiger]|nr:hypothetical protein BDF14DRAFT_1847429 [Spinellus fusiger]